MAKREMKQGVVEKVFIKKLPEEDKMGNSYRHALKVDGEWYAFNNSKFDVFLCDDPTDPDSGKKILGDGSEIIFYFERNGDWKNANKTGFMVTNLVEGKRWEPPQGNKGGAGGGSGGNSKPKDLTGMHVGHALKGATTLTSRLKRDFMEGAKEVIDVTETLTKELKEKGQSEFEAGNAAGNAVLNACFLVGKTGSVENAARKILDTHVPEIRKYIEEKNAPEPEAEETPEEKEDTPSEPEGDSDDDFDEDCPF